MAPDRLVLVTAPNFDRAAIDYLRDEGIEPLIADAPAEAQRSPAELIDLARAVDAWIIGPSAGITRDLIAAVPRCVAFARRGVGYERLDMDALRDLGRIALIAAGGNEDSVADQVVGLMLAVARRMREQHLAMLRGDWTIRVSGDLFRKTIGIVGLGRTGRALVRRLRGFEARIIVVAPRPDMNFVREFGLEIVDLDVLLRAADVLTLHAPLTPATRHVIDAEALARMKPGAILINAGRGGLVDDRALLAALKSGHLGGAGLDCYEAESDPALRDIAMELLAQPNVVGTPHSAASTREGLERTNMIAARCVVAALRHEAPPPGCLVVDGRG